MVVSLLLHLELLSIVKITFFIKITGVLNYYVTLLQNFLNKILLTTKDEILSHINTNKIGVKVILI